MGSLFSPRSGALLPGMNGLLPVDEIRFRVEVPAVDSLKMPRTTAFSFEMAISLPVPVAPGALLIACSVFRCHGDGVSGRLFETC